MVHTHRKAIVPIITALICWMVFPHSSTAQTATNLCDQIASAQYAVNGSCVNQAFTIGGSAPWTSSLNPQSCNSGNFRDGWGWFIATSAHTTVQFAGNQDAILHVFTGTCAALQPVACSDAFGGANPESVTIPTVPGQAYFVRVQRWNSSGGISGNLCVFNSSPSSACGTTVYDSGGASGNYSNLERRIITYCPDAPGEAVTMNFSQFAVQGLTWLGDLTDYMQIFSGSGTGGQLMGTWWGNNSPGTITSTHPSGCLTVVFFSNGSTTAAGWTASVSCDQAPDCFYVLTLNDSFGDGWSGSSVGYSINGGPYQNWTINGATGQVIIPVNVGDIFVLNYNATGPWQNENSFNLAISGQSGLYTSGPPPAPGLHFPHTVDCISPPAPPEDCLGAFTICSNLAFNGNTNNTGWVADLNTGNRGCLGANERQGTWYTFSPSEGGTLAFTISPTNPADDYDFAIWGPYLPGSTTADICPPSGPPLRCSYAAPGGDTGLNFTATDLSEGPLGDKWVRHLDVQEGQVYLLYISNWSQSGLAFGLNWNPASTADLDCTILPVDLAELRATPNAGSIDVHWTTLSEQNTQKFIVERSGDGSAFAPLGSIQAQGDSHHRIDYRFVDSDPIRGLNYYRMKSVDREGREKNSNVVTAHFGLASPKVVPNPAGQQASLYLTHGMQQQSVLRIVDNSGRLVSQGTIDVGTLQQVMDISALAGGSYTISWHAADGTPLGNSRFVKE